jgi:phosphopantetheinyl transferase
MAVSSSAIDGPTVDIWVIDLDCSALLDGHPDALTGGDREEAGRLRDHTAAVRLLARRSATRSIIAETLGARPGDVDIERRCRRCGSGDHGRPFVAGGPVSFSVSSSHELAAVATSTGVVGVDLELVASAGVPAELGLAPAEQRHVEALAPDLRTPTVLRLWTAKEAVLKADGLGIADGLSTIDAMAVLGEGPSVMRGDGGDRFVRQWNVDLGPERNFVLALATAGGGGGGVRWHRLPAPLKVGIGAF